MLMESHYQKYITLMEMLPEWNYVIIEGLYYIKA